MDATYRMDTTQAIHEYRKAAFLRAINRTPGLVLNDGIDYANILIHSMIGISCQAGDHVCIYSGNLPRDSYDVALRLTPAERIFIVLDDDSTIGCLSELPQELLNRIELRKIKDGKKFPKHFFFTSSGAYRMEIDAVKFKAEADFNSPENIKSFKTAWPNYIAHSIPLATPQHGACCQDGSSST
jgi:hypothetical protein